MSTNHRSPFSMTSVRCCTLSLALSLGAAGLAQATEGGGSAYPRGVENYLAGAVPPPGLYWLGYGNVYSADRLNDKDGNEIPIPGFKVQAGALVLRPVWSTTYQALGGNIVFHSVIPLVDLKVNAAGNSQHKTGIGDVTVGIGLATHYSPQFHTALGLDLVLPTGGYGKDDLANIGRNYATWQPLYALSWTDAKGFNGDLKFTFNLNQRNKDTDYRSGNELFIDYAAGWGLGNGWTVGVGGHAWQQLGNDKSAGATLADSKVRAFSIGPSIKYDNGAGWFITAKLQKETAVRNSTQGTAFWLKTLIPF
ncbi:SphA family protein [Roseateles sp. LYH14W]|uniref:Transporter n=1 Tax=Pelomonas parva TaxID=3299032 RepID=A0ABW7F8T4_9BURK